MSTGPDSARPIDHAPDSKGSRLQIDERPDGGVTITAPSRRKHFERIGRWLDGSAILLWPLMWLLYRCFASDRPRAILWMTPEEFVLTERSDEGLGYAATRSWPRAALTELRANRYENGIYLRVAGKENLDLLTDVPPGEVRQIGAALESARTRLAARP
jgi:hypothetical protein